MLLLCHVSICSLAEYNHYGKRIKIETSGVTVQNASKNVNLFMWLEEKGEIPWHYLTAWPFWLQVPPVKPFMALFFHVELWTKSLYKGSIVISGETVASSHAIFR